MSTDPQTREAPAREGTRAAGASWTVELPILALLNANDRHHWGHRHRVTGYIRAAAWAATCAAKVPALARARIVCELRFPDRRRRDPANWTPSAKAAVDGLVDARVLPDDSATYLDGPDMRLGEPEPRRQGRRDAPGFGRIVLHITEVA